MRKKLRVLFLLLAVICWLNPVFSGENSFKAASDTTIHFIQGITDYNLLLEGREQLFAYNTIQPLTNNAAKLWIKNNSGKSIAIITVKSSSSGKLLADLAKPERNVEIKPGESFCITIRPVDRPGPLSAQASIRYKTDGEEKELIIRVKGTVANKPEPSVTGRPEGLTRFEIGELTTREKHKKDYLFALEALPERRAFGFAVKPKKELVFSWDTLRTDEFLPPLLFHFKNTSAYSVTILKIEGKDGAVYYRNAVNKIVLMPDSSLTIEAIPNLFSKGHFYHSLVISYQSISGVNQFEMKQWGYVPNEFKGISAEDSLQLKVLRTNFYGPKNKDKNNLVRVYVYREGKSIYRDARLELFSKESRAIIQSKQDENGNSFFQIQRNGWDTLLIHVLSPKGEVLQKTRLVHPFEYDYYGLPFFRVTSPYTYYLGKSPYKVLDGIYKLAPKDNPYSDVDPTVIKKYIANTPIQFMKNGTVEIKNLDKAIVLEKKLMNSASPIRLLPVTDAENGIHWYSNSFTIIFYEHVSDGQIMKIFANYKITNYSQQTGYTRNSWTFSLESVLDRKYVALLDQLWHLKEVSGLIQEKTGIDGHD